MTKLDFLEDLDRLTRAHRVEMTTERADAIYELVKWATGEVWRQAVNLLAADDRWPRRERLLETVEKAHDMVKVRARANATTDVIPAARGLGADASYGVFRMDLLGRMFPKRGPALDEAGLVEALESGIRLFPDHAAVLAEEVAFYGERPLAERYGRWEAREVDGLAGLEVWQPLNGRETPFEAELTHREIDARRGMRPGWTFWRTRIQGSERQ